MIRGIQPRQKHLVNLCNLFNGRILSNDFVAQCIFELLGIAAETIRIEGLKNIASHICTRQWFSVPAPRGSPLVRSNSRSSFRSLGSAMQSPFVT